MIIFLFVAVAISLYLFIASTVTCPDLFSFDLANLPFVRLTALGLKTKGLLSKSSRFSYSCLISLACALVTDNPVRLIKAVASASTFPHPGMPLASTASSSSRIGSSCHRKGKDHLQHLIYYELA